MAPSETSLGQMAAFICTPGAAVAKADAVVCSAGRCDQRPSRRAFVRTAAAAAVGLWVTWGTEADADAYLPDGAKQFSKVVSAQRQWDGVLQAFQDGRVPPENEWENLRTYLRGVYSVSGDMEFLARRWEPSRRDVGLGTIRDFRKAVKALDKPAAIRDVEGFAKGHGEVAQLFSAFFDELKQDSVGDMPAEL